MPQEQTNYAELTVAACAASSREHTFTSFNIVIGTLWALMIAARAPIPGFVVRVFIIFNSAIESCRSTAQKRTLEKLSLIGEAK